MPQHFLFYAHPGRHAWAIPLLATTFFPYQPSPSFSVRHPFAIYTTFYIHKWSSIVFKSVCIFVLCVREISPKYSNRPNTLFSRFGVIQKNPNLRNKVEILSSLQADCVSTERVSHEYCVHISIQKAVFSRLPTPTPAGTRTRAFTKSTAPILHLAFGLLPHPHLFYGTSFLLHLFIISFHAFPVLNFSCFHGLIANSTFPDHFYNLSTLCAHRALQIL